MGSLAEGTSAEEQWVVQQMRDSAALCCCKTGKCYSSVGCSQVPWLSKQGNLSAVLGIAQASFAVVQAAVNNLARTER